MAFSVASFKMDPLGGAYTAVDEANNDTYRIASNSSTPEFAMDRRFVVNSKRDGIGVFRSLDNAKAAAQADSGMSRQRSVDNLDPTGRYMPGAERCKGPQGCCDPEICDGRGYLPAIVIVTTGRWRSIGGNRIYRAENEAIRVTAALMARGEFDHVIRSCVHCGSNLNDVHTEEKCGRERAS